MIILYHSDYIIYLYVLSNILTIHTIIIAD